MAQYTTALAADYNNLQSTVATILGMPASTNAIGYGTSISSSQVSVGQEIKAHEWNLLANDINSAYWFQTSTNWSPPSIVSSGQILWSNVVSYQNIVSTILSNAQNRVVYNPKGGGGFVTQTLVLQSNQGQFDHTPAEYGFRTVWSFSNGIYLTQFFNTGGSLTVNYVTYAGQTTKDAVYDGVVRSVDWTYTWSNWNLDLSNGLNNIIRTADSTNTYGSPYNSPGHTLSAYSNWNYSGSSIYVNAGFIDNDATSTEGGVSLPHIQCGTYAYVYINSGAGGTPPGGGSAISTLQVPGPTDWNGGYSFWFNVY